MIFAQLSDLHIKGGGRLAYGKVDTQFALRRAVARLAELKGLQLVMVSGDLVDVPGTSGYEILARAMSELPCPWYAMPGNHDGRELMRQCLASAQPQFPHEGYLDYVVDAGALRLLALDTLVEGKPYGEIRPSQLDWLEEQLSSDSRPAVLFMHHPPCPLGLRGMDEERCLNAELLTPLLRRHRQLRHIACGHVHRDIAVLWNECLVTTAPGASHSVALDFDFVEQTFTLEPTYCRVFLFEEGRLAHHIYPLHENYPVYPFFNAQGELID